MTEAATESSFFGASVIIAYAEGVRAGQEACASPDTDTVLTIAE